MNKKWLLLGLLVFVGCAQKDPVEEEKAKQDLERMSVKTKKNRTYIVKETEAKKR